MNTNRKFTLLTLCVWRNYNAGRTKSLSSSTQSLFIQAQVLELHSTEANRRYIPSSVPDMFSSVTDRSDTSNSTINPYSIGYTRYRHAVSSNITVFIKSTSVIRVDSSVLLSWFKTKKQVFWESCFQYRSSLILVYLPITRIVGKRIVDSDRSVVETEKKAIRES